LKQVISEACSIARSYKFTTTPPLKLVKFVDEKEQHRKTHPKPCSARPNENNCKATTRKEE
jgi:hypothetical protein